MGTVPELLVAKFDDLPVNDLIVTMNHIADKSETHVAFEGNLPEYVTSPAKLRDMAAVLGRARDAAFGGDQGRVAEQKALIKSGTHALSLNACHIVLLSLYRNDPDILLNAGYELKQRPTARTTPPLLDLLPDVYVKHGTASGAVNVLVKRAKPTSSIELQMTDQDPSLETSWKSQGIYNRSRIEIRGLNPTSRVYFRARYHEDGGTGQWSPLVNLIIL